jgi:hypothetical protein
MLNNIVSILIFIFVVLLMVGVILNSLYTPSRVMNDYHMISVTDILNDIPPPQSSLVQHEQKVQQLPTIIKQQSPSPTLCEASLNRRYEHEAHPSSEKNETPLPVTYPSPCLRHVPAYPERATSGTGVGEPAYEDVNEFPAPYQNDKKKPCSNGNRFFNVQPRDEYSELNGIIDYQINIPPVSGLVCQRPSGLGQPAEEKENEFPAEYKC